MTENVSHTVPDDGDLSRRLLHKFRLLRQEFGERKDERNAVAVIGMACRFPGGCTTPDAFWRFLREKGDGITDVPADRWNIDDYFDPKPGTPGKMYVRQAGFLQEDVGEFDARFFRISPAEAKETDPQQRMLLEVSWEALENANQNPDHLRGGNVGVFVGIIASEYAMLPRDPLKASPYAGTGTITCIASGRISHTLGFHGPALSVDTACSSSLVSVHCACGSLINGECDMALAGGVNMMLSPWAIIPLCTMGALAKDGRCKPFDASGDGYGRAEGCGMVVLKRLSDARRDGDSVLAVIRGGAVNHDGPGSGLTVPNGNAQRMLILSALRNAGINPDDMGFLEAHGTGTSLGDPIEMKALAQVFGNGRSPENPLLIGSVKGNIGHLEGAAGISGLIKAVLCLRHREIPPNIHLNTLNPRIRTETIPAVIPTDPAPWKEAPGKERIAGVSAFGFSGTNAHIILSEPPPDLSYKTPGESETPPCADRGLSVLALSAKSDTALNRLAARYRDHILARPELNIADLCHTADSCRARFTRRAAFLARSADEMAGRLDRFVSGDASSGQDIFSGSAEEGSQPGIAFLFSGDAGSVAGAGKELYETSPYFRKTLEECAGLSDPYPGETVLEGLYPGNKNPDTDPGLRDVCLFSLEHALCRLWESLGVSPRAVFAEKTGMYAAACAAGVMTAETAAKLAAGSRDISGETYKAPRCRFIPGDSGTPVRKQDIVSPGFWQRRPDSAGGFEKGIRWLYEQGIRFFTEIGPGSGLLEKARPHLPGEGVHYLPSLSDSPWESLVRNLAQLYCSGADIRWEVPDPDCIRRKVSAPTYPFEKKRYWIDQQAAPRVRQEPEAKSVRRGDPLEGNRIFSPSGGDRSEFQHLLSTDRLSELNDTHGLVHVGYFQEMLCRAVRASFGVSSYAVGEMSFLTGLMIGDAEKTVHLTLTPGKDGETDFQFHSREAGEQRWSLHVRGTLSADPGSVSTVRRDIPEMTPDALEEIRTRCDRVYSGPDFYRMMETRGIRLGPGVQRADEVRYREGEVIARFKVPGDRQGNRTYALPSDPGILDACAQVFHAALSQEAGSDMGYMVVRWDDFIAGSPGETDGALWCHVILRENPGADGSVRGLFRLYDSGGRLIAATREAHMRGLNADRVESLKAAGEFGGEADAAMIRKLADASPEERTALLTEYFREIMAETLEMPVSDLDVRESLLNLGMDSLTGVRFRTAVQGTLGMDIPLEEMIQGTPISALAEKAAVSVRTEHGQEKTRERKSETKTAPQSRTDEDADRDDRRIWFAHRSLSPVSEIRLFCFPYGMQGASIFREWQDRVPDYIEVCPVQLPGRENRYKEMPPTDIGAMTDMLENALAKDLDRPYAFYGHSGGAMFAFRVACRLRNNAKIGPAHFFAGGFTSPVIPNPILYKRAAEFTAAGFDGLPGPDQVTRDNFDQIADILIEPEFAHLMIRSKEYIERGLATLKMIESCFDNPEKEKPSDFPITVFHGKDDQVVSQKDMEAWKPLTTGPFGCHILPGDHLFMDKDQCRDRLIELIVGELAMHR